MPAFRTLNVMIHPLAAAVHPLTFYGGKFYV
jgi:hypothetical protein